MELTATLPKAVANGIGEVQALKGQLVGPSPWREVSQEMIDQFAELSGDDQWIHVDVERARRESPFRAPIAHGFLTLSLLPHFMHEALAIKQRVRMGVNYGLNRVRFVSPVPAGSNIRARVALQSLKEIPPNAVEVVFNATVELEGAEKPCCVAEWIARYYV